MACYSSYWKLMPFDKVTLILYSGSAFFFFFFPFSTFPSQIDLSTFLAFPHCVNKPG
jgi:hypothetical protein